MATTFENKCAILADLWLNYKDNEELSTGLSTRYT